MNIKNKLIALALLFSAMIPMPAATSVAKTPNAETIVQAGHFIEDFDISPDGKYAVTCNNTSIALWDIDLRKMIRWISVPTKSKVRFDAVKPEIAFFSDPGNLLTSPRSNSMCTGINVFTGEKTGAMPEDELEKRNSYHEKYILKLKDGKIEITSLKDRRLIGYLDGNTSTDCGRLDISPNDSLVALGGPEPIVWDIRNARLATVVPYSEMASADPALVVEKNTGLLIPASKAGGSKYFHYGYLDQTRCRFSDDTHLLVGGYSPHITEWDLSGSSVSVRPVLSATIPGGGAPVYDFAVSGDYTVAATYSGLMHADADRTEMTPVDGYTSKNDYLGVYCLTEGPTPGSFLTGHENRTVMMGSFSNPLDRTRIDICNHAVHHLAVTPDSRGVIVSGQMGMLYEASFSKEDAPFKYNTAPLQFGVMQGTVFLSPDRFATVCRDGSVSFWTRGHKDFRKSVQTHHANAYGIGLTADRRHLITSDSQGSLRFWNPDTEELTMSAFLINDRKDYVFLTPDNYYKASKGAYTGVHFTKGLEVYPFEQFDLLLNRPDIILERLGAPASKVDLYRQAWLKRLRKMGIAEKELSAELELPAVTVLNQRQLDEVSEASSVAVNFSIVDPAHTLNRVFVNLNGVPLLGRNGEDISAKRLRKFTRSMNIDLCSGQNTIEIFAINSAGAESLRKTIEISGIHNPSAKPELYVIGIGVSDYADKNFNLNYAAKDATDITELLSETAIGFGNVEKLLLTDKEFSPASLAAIKDFVRKSKRDDTIILFYAGHGLLDDNLDYYLSYHAINFANPAANGIPYERFEAVLDGAGALNRLVLIDACHSGEIDKEDFVAQTSEVKASGIQFRAAGNSAGLRKGHGVEETRLLFNDLFMDIRWGSGSTVVSSAGGLEVAFEGDRWNNGLFTWCMKDGLTSRKADLNSDGAISSKEIGEFLCSEVARISEGVQIPTLRTLNVRNDFSIF